jgi:hypothetical protein
MPEITITFDLPDFHDSTVWVAGDKEVKALTRQAQELAERFLLPLDRMLRGAAVHAREGLTVPNPVNVQGTRSLISAYVLKLPTGAPGHPGLIGDYLPVWDFTVVFTNVDRGKIMYTVAVHERGDIAGSA